MKKHLLYILALFLVTSCEQKPASRVQIERPAPPPQEAPAPKPEPVITDSTSGIVELDEPPVVMDSTPVETPVTAPPPLETPVVVEEKAPLRVAAASKPNLPTTSKVLRTMFTNPVRIQNNIALAAKGDVLLQRAVKDAINTADRAMQEPIQVLTTKTYQIFRADKRNFESVGPYWHQDSQGKWIMRDGKGNGLSERVGDTKKLQRLGSILPALAYGYAATTNLSQHEKYAIRIVQHCQAFFLDARTGMLPNMRYANAIPGKPDQIYAPVEFEKLVDVTDALVQIENSAAYTPEFRQAIRKWFADLATYMATSEQGREAEKRLVGNIATIYELERLAFAVFGGDAQYAAKRWPRIQNLLDAELDSKGRFWRELDRAKPNMYSNKSIQAWFKLFRILNMQGVDAWKWERNGKSFVQAVRVHNQAMLGKWVMKKGEKVNPEYWTDGARTAQLVYWDVPGVSEELNQFLNQFDGGFRKGSAKMLHTPYLRYKW